MIHRLLVCVFCLTAAMPASAAVTPELQRQIRAATFEVVQKKPSDDSVTYEKPLPLDLLPYVERTDAYRSIGTAFALGNNTYVTAAHVLQIGIGSQYGPPALRGSDGKVHPIASILKFSAFEDFVVFSIADDSGLMLETNRSPQVDEPVLAVGNALGEGVVIREGLFTSETPEAQDGRWKWIRFSAAASPGNSGGPLLDASGKVVGVVIAKSPNENLNYALPISNVLDAPPARARFDQRILNKLPFGQGTNTYLLKDEFSLPLSWEKFSSTYREVINRNSEKSRDALVSAVSASMFPRGTGSEDIIFASHPASTVPAAVTQRPDGTWILNTPDLEFTSLPGDGSVGVGQLSGVTVLKLVRGDEASDDSFYSNSKSFMDIALKALNVRRPVGTDQVRAVSLGSALTDEGATDSYGRKWQLRTWPLPAMDIYLVAQLLPTPDGYAGLIAFAPSFALYDTKMLLSSIANQVTITYAGTIPQWRAFLARKPLLPDSLQEVVLDSAPEPKLRTRKFEIGIPASVMKMDAHSRLDLSMAYTFDGPRLVWDLQSVWWYRDSQEKNYVGLHRVARPPATVKLETRNWFDDLQAARGAYTGLLSLPTNDSAEASMRIQAPGTKEGTASSDVVYAMTIHWDGRISGDSAAAAETAALQGVRITERSVGPDVAISTPKTVLSNMNEQLESLNKVADACRSAGKDVRGRVCNEDVEEFLKPLFLTAYQQQMGSADRDALRKEFDERLQALSRYWQGISFVMHNRDLWQPFLARNHLVETTPHDEAIAAAESKLKTLVSAGGAPTDTWVESVQALNQAYVAERQQLIGKLPHNAPVEGAYHGRKSNCPEPATATSKGRKPRPASSSSSLEEFYPKALKTQGVEGSAVLSAKVNSSGCATEVAIASSSGSDELDEAALKWFETATFLPAEKDGKAVDGVGSFLVKFQLN